MELIFRFFEDLTMLGPADNQITRGIRQSLPLPDDPVILDIGSGKGRQTRILADAKPDSRIVPTDVYIPYLQAIRDIPGTSPVCGTMDNLPFKEDSIDLIWSEGAINIMGFSQGITAWKPLLKDGGYLAISESAGINPILRKICGSSGKRTLPAHLLKKRESGMPKQQDIPSPAQ